MTGFAIIGAGFVADLYMGSLKLYPEIPIRGVFDRRPERAAAFCSHWGLAKHDSLEALLAACEPGDIVLNLTNPSSHYEVSRAVLEAGFHVYSEKPLAMEMGQATALTELAAEKGLRLTSAPCSFLGEAAQTLWAAVRAGYPGKVRLVYAEMDDDFVPAAPYRKWISESGAPWPWQDEVEVGCTLEHAGYYLAWLLPVFGPVKRVISASADLAEKGLEQGRSAPDFSTGTLYFESGVVARLTCSILAPHDHELRVIGDDGLLELEDCWNNRSALRYRRRFTLRRRLVTMPFGKRLRLPGPTHLMQGRRGAASMNFALGPVELREAVMQDRPGRMPMDLALHMNEVTLALQAGGGVHEMTTRFDPAGVAPMDWARRLKGGAA